MAKKPANTKKKATASARKATVTAKKKTSAVKKPTDSVRKTTANARKTPVLDNIPVPSVKPILGSATDPHSIDLLPNKVIDSINTDLDRVMQDLKDLNATNLNTLQRKRKIGPGIRNYGFIDKASDLAEANPRFVQFFDISDFKNSVRNLETCRDIAIKLHTIARIVTNLMLIYCDDAYGFALIFYNLIKNMSKRGDAEAMELYKELFDYFKKKHKNLLDEPTEKELMHDVHSVLRGKKEGEITISSKSPKVVAGKRTIIDDVHKSVAMFKETEEGQIKN